jgi:hypothetical protein
MIKYIVQYFPQIFSQTIWSHCFHFQTGTTISPFIVDLGGDQNPNVPPGKFSALVVFTVVAVALFIQFIFYIM